MRGMHLEQDQRVYHRPAGKQWQSFSLVVRECLAAQQGFEILSDIGGMIDLMAERSQIGHADWGQEASFHERAHAAGLTGAECAMQK